MLLLNTVGLFNLQVKVSLSIAHALVTARTIGFIILYRIVNF